MSKVSDALSIVWEVIDRANDKAAADAMSVVFEYLDVLEGAYGMGDDEMGLYEEGGLLYEEDEDWDDDGQPSEHDEWMDYDPDC